MNSEGKRGVHVFVLFLSLILLSASCSSGPSAPAKGSPAWYWQAAGETYSAGDYLKTNDHLDHLVKAGNEFAPRAQPWRMVLSAGLASGYMELADTAELGSRANPASAAKFRILMSGYRKQANSEAVNFAETFIAFRKSNPEGNVPLTFSFPSGSSAPVAELARMGQGMVLSDAERTAAGRRVLTRGLVLAACSAVGADEDVAKAQQVYSGENVTVPKDTFVLAMAAKMHKVAKLYSPDKANRPERYSLFLQTALDATNSVAPNDESKKQAEAIEKDLKTVQKTSS